MTITLGMAAKDENGKYRGGKAGDQTGKEVYLCNWYNRPWDTVIRWKSEDNAKGFANILRLLCANNNVGYDQVERTTLWAEAQRINWQPTRIGEIKACECDCSSLMAVCARFLGFAVSKDIWTGNLEAAFRATKAVEVYKTSEYTSKPDNLKVGDILLNTQHHVAAVVSITGSTTVAGKPTGAGVLFHEAAKSGVPFEVTASALNMRKDAPNGAVITAFKKGTRVTWYGYHKIIDGQLWLWVKCGSREGYMSKQYLKGV